MKGVNKRVPYVRADGPAIEKQLKVVETAKTAADRAEAQFLLFKMVWRLPENKAVRTLTRSYIWPNIREWRKDYRDGILNLRCYCITMENAFRHLKTGQNNG